MKTLVFACALAGLTVFSLQPARSADSGSTANGILVKDAWLRATPHGAPVAGGYATITNAASAPDRLVSASLSSAPKGEVHAMSMENGVMHMSRLDQGLDIAPGATVTLKPGGFHLMFLNPSAPLKEGETVKGTLTFAKAGVIPVTFAVAGMAAKGAPGGMEGMDMGKMH